VSDSYVGATEGELIGAPLARRLPAYSDQRRPFPHQGTLQLTPRPGPRRLARDPEASSSGRRCYHLIRDGELALASFKEQWRVSRSAGGQILSEGSQQ
jgi:hypothetical protein